MNRSGDVKRVPCGCQDIRQAHGLLPVVEELGDGRGWPAQLQHGLHGARVHATAQNATCYQDLDCLQERLRSVSFAVAH